MNLTEYAENELKLAGLMDGDFGDNYNALLATSTLDIVRLFSTQGHSGASAEIVADLLNKLLRYEPLTPLTYEPDEWIDQTEATGGEPFFQNKRDFKVFSRDGGKTHYKLDDSVPDVE